LGLPEPKGKHPILGYLIPFAGAAKQDRLDQLVDVYFKETQAKTIHLPGSFAFRYVATIDPEFFKLIFTEIGS
jgi:hypothetical protein